MLYDSKEKTGVKVSRERVDGKTVRVSKKSGEKI